MLRPQLRREYLESLSRAKTNSFSPIPDLSVPALPPQVLSLAEDGTARAGVAGPSKARSGAPELDRGAYERALSKREKMAVSGATDSLTIATKEGHTIRTLGNDPVSTSRRALPDEA